MGYIVNPPEGIDRNSILFKLFDPLCEKFDETGTTPEYYNKAMGRLMEYYNLQDTMEDGEKKKFLEGIIDVVEDCLLVTGYLYFSTGFKNGQQMSAELAALLKVPELERRE